MRREIKQRWILENNENIFSFGFGHTITISNGYEHYPGIANKYINKLTLLIFPFAVKELNCEDASQRSWNASILKAHSSHTNTGYRHIHNGSRFTAHLQPRSTAPQPDEISWESILLREENQSTQRKTVGVRLNIIPHANQGSIAVILIPQVVTVVQGVSA